MDVCSVQPVCSPSRPAPSPVDPYVAPPGAVPFADYLGAVNRVRRIEAPDAYEPTARPEEPRACAESRRCEANEGASEAGREPGAADNADRGTPTLADVAPVPIEVTPAPTDTARTHRVMSPLGAMIDLTV